MKRMYLNIVLLFIAFELNAQNKITTENDSVNFKCANFNTQSIDRSKIKKWVNDFEKVFNEYEIKNLENLITVFEKESNFKIYIITTNDFKESIVKNKNFKKESDLNETLIFINKNDNKIYIDNKNESIISNEKLSQLMGEGNRSTLNNKNYYLNTKNVLEALVTYLKAKL